MQSWEKSFDAADSGSRGPNRKIIDIAQRNINSSFDLAKSLAGAKNLAEKGCGDAISLLAQAVRHTRGPGRRGASTLSTQVAADAAKSIEGGIHKMK